MNEFVSCNITAKSSCNTPEKNTPDKEDLQSHWNSTYFATKTEQLGWYENYPEPSLRLIRRTRLGKDTRMLHVGTGTSTLIDELIKDGYHNIIANDLSETALNSLRKRLENSNDSVEWIVDDLLRPEKLNLIKPVDLWHDRAVLHFFTEIKDQDAYFALLRKLVKPGGYVIIACFNKNSAEKCSGLPVKRYNELEIAHKLGDEFKMCDHFNYTYIMPSGEKRQYVYTLFERKLEIN